MKLIITFVLSILTLSLLGQQFSAMRSVQHKSLPDTLVPKPLQLNVPKFTSLACNDVSAPTHYSYNNISGCVFYENGRVFITTYLPNDTIQWEVASDARRQKDSWMRAELDSIAGFGLILQITWSSSYLPRELDKQQKKPTNINTKSTIWKMLVQLERGEVLFNGIAFIGHEYKNDSGLRYGSSKYETDSRWRVIEFRNHYLYLSEMNWMYEYVYITRYPEGIQEVDSDKDKRDFPPIAYKYVNGLLIRDYEVENKTD